MSGISLEKVSKSYGNVTAVADVSISIDAGSFVTFLGPSGSGKTTTLRMIAGLERPSSGTIRIGDRVVSEGGVFVPTYKRRLGMVFQSYAVWPHKTVFENVAFPLDQLGIGKAERNRRVESMLSKVELGGFGGRYPSQLSGGQQQRVSLARALVAAPEVVLFDEPLSNLDAKLRESMRELLRELHDDVGTTAVYVTHDQVEAMVLSDSIHIMNKGRIVQSGSPRDLFERPKSRFVAEFVGYANILPIDAADAKTGTVRLPGGDVIKVSCVPSAVVENVLVVRPHRVGLVRGQGNDANVIEGTVRSAAFLGDRTHLSVDVAGCGTVLADIVSSGVEVPAKGEVVKLGFPSDAATVL